MSRRPKPESSHSPKMTVRGIAQHFGVDRSTVCRWIHLGCPVSDLGSVGRGRGSQLDPESVTHWLVSRHVPVVVQQSDDRVLGLVAHALLDAVKRDDLARRTKTTEPQAALAVMIIFERVFRNVKQAPLTRDQVPEHLMQLCTIYLDSVERDTFTDTRRKAP